MNAPGVETSAVSAGLLTPQVRERVRAAQVAWLTTVTAAGTPSPTPVWFVLSAEDEIVVFSSLAARKVANIRRSPRVTAHLNCDPAGGGVTVLTGTARLDQGVRASAQPGYLEKYGRLMAERGTSAERFDVLSPVRIRVRPERVWLGAGRLTEAAEGKRRHGS
jgi:PPOX class probable F420-dependent enzyme